MKKALLLVTALLLVAASLASCSVNTAKFDMTKVSSLADLAGAKIAAQSGTFHYDALQQIEGAFTTDYEDFDSLFVALQSGAIDGYIAEEPTAIDICTRNDGYAYVALKNNSTGFTASEADTAIAVGIAKGSSLTAQINTVLATLTAEQKSALMQQMVDVNAGKEVGTLAITSTTPTETTGTLKVAMECAYAPFNWTQNTDANGAQPIANDNLSYVNGYDYQIAKYIADNLGLKLEVYAEKWDSLITGVQAGTYDCIIAGMSPTDERKEEIDFSDNYYVSNLVIIYKK